MVSSTISRLFFFGGRYLSLLFVAGLLGADATGFLLAVAISELFRIVFDYGLENSVLARLHQKGAVAGEFMRGKGPVRLLATFVGQCVTTGVIALWCLSNDIPLALPLVASLQFSCLMGFGYLQAHLQTGPAGGMAALIRPLAFVAALQGALLILASQELVPLWLCTISFESAALLACALVAQYFRREPLSQAFHASFSGFDAPTLRKVLLGIAPLGNVALIGVAYTRIDALAVSLVASGSLLAQYLIYQRLASAPLMFFSTVASVSIARFSGRGFSAEDLPRRVGQIRRRAYMAAVMSGATLAVCSPLIASFFAIESVDPSLVGLQCLVLTLQISNGFHAAFLIALHESSRLWVIARNNTVLAALIMPLAAWRLEAVGVALALCVVEMFCAAQYLRLFHGSKLAQMRHAE